MGRIGQTRVGQARYARPSIRVDTGELTSVQGESKQSLDKVKIKSGKSPATVSVQDSSENTIATEPAVKTPLSTSVLNNDKESYEVKLAGTALVSGSTVEGAEITVVREDTDEVVRNVTSDSNGEWSVTLPGGPVYHIFSEYEGGGTQYNTKSRPFIDTSASEVK